ncbi:MAG: alpha/beta hydrolase [Chloroflexi bacterium]|nr:alpha/beta hydrolase [Chloroflexota bacterium]
MKDNRLRLIVGVISGALGALLAVLVVRRLAGMRPSLQSRLVKSLAQLNASNEHRSIQAVRAQFENAYGRVPLPRGVSRRDVDANGVPAAWLLPSGIAQGQPITKAILYLHSGGYVIGSIEAQKTYAAALAKASDTPTLIIDYRLAPENPFPAALDDALSAYRWLLEQGIAAEQVALVGDSAGGGLSAALTLKLKDLGIALPAALVLVSPWLDLTLSGESIQSKAETEVVLTRQDIDQWASWYAGDTPRDHPLISPVFGDASAFPPTLILVSDEEILLSEAEVFAQRLEAAGRQVELQVWVGMIHAWPVVHSFMPEAREAMQIMGDFARRHL